jgi:hypothetical protein
MLLGLCTSGTAGRWLRPKRIWIRLYSLQRQTTRESSTPYSIWSHHSWLKRREPQLKRTKLGCNAHRSFYPNSMVVGEHDFTTCQPDLTRPRTSTQNVPEALVATPRGFLVPGKWLESRGPQIARLFNVRQDNM